MVGASAATAEHQGLSPIPGGPIAKVYFGPQSPPELEFVTDR